MAMTGPVPIVRYGIGDNCQPVAWPVATAAQLWDGEVALKNAAGLIKNAGTPLVTDVVVGMVDGPAGGTVTETGAGIVGGSTDGAVWINARTGAFFFQSAAAGDLLSEATAGKTVYYAGENASGPIAAATDGGGTRPVLGVQLPQDPGIAGGSTPGSNYFPVVLNAVPKP